MTRIEKLTNEQLARMAEFSDRWIEIGLCTAPADRPAAEAAIVESYRCAGLEPPRRIVWCGSPLSQGLTRAIVLQHGDSVRASVGDSVRASVGASVGDSVGASVYGQHDANWLAFYEYFRDACGLSSQTEKLRGLTALARSAGWALPHAGICWVSERHQVLARDAGGRLHSITGPSVLYPDGWAIYAVHGTRVPAEWIEQPGKLDAKTALTWANVEQRRAAAEILGWAKILEAVNARIINRDRNPLIGTLLEADLPDAPGSRFLQVRCATGRDFVLPVPRECLTARAANAWTFDLKPRELRLETRT